MVNSCPLEKENMLQIDNVMDYVSPQKNFKNTEVFTKKIAFEIEIVVSTRPL